MKVKTELTCTRESSELYVALQCENKNRNTEMRAPVSSGAVDRISEVKNERKLGVVRALISPHDGSN